MGRCSTTEPHQLGIFKVSNTATRTCSVTTSSLDLHGVLSSRSRVLGPVALPVDDQLGLPVEAAAAVAAEVALASVALAVDDQLRLPAEAAPALLARVVLPSCRGRVPGVARCARLPGTLQRLLRAPAGQRGGPRALPARVRPVVDDEHRLPVEAAAALLTRVGLAPHSARRRGPRRALPGRRGLGAARALASWGKDGRGPRGPGAGPRPALPRRQTSHHPPETRCPASHGAALTRAEASWALRPRAVRRPRL